MSDFTKWRSVAVGGPLSVCGLHVPSMYPIQSPKIALKSQLFTSMSSMPPTPSSATS